MASFSKARVETRRQWIYIFIVLRKNRCQPRDLFPGEICFNNEGEIKPI